MLQNILNHSLVPLNDNKYDQLIFVEHSSITNNLC